MTKGAQNEMIILTTHHLALHTASEKCEARAGVCGDADCAA